MPDAPVRAAMDGLLWDSAQPVGYSPESIPARLIVPVAMVGVDDAYHIVADKDDLVLRPLRWVRN